MIFKRQSLFAALAFALPIAGLLSAPAMAAKPQKPKIHHAVKKASAHKPAVKHTHNAVKTAKAVKPAH